MKLARGAATVEVTPQGTRAYLVYGQRLAVTARGQTEELIRPEFQIRVSPGQTPNSAEGMSADQLSTDFAAMSGKDPCAGAQANSAACSEGEQVANLDSGTANTGNEVEQQTVAPPPGAQGADGPADSREGRPANPRNAPSYNSGITAAFSARRIDGLLITPEEDSGTDDNNSGIAFGGAVTAASDSDDVQVAAADPAQTSGLQSFFDQLTDQGFDSAFQPVGDEPDGDDSSSGGGGDSGSGGGSGSGGDSGGDTVGDSDGDTGGGGDSVVGGGGPVVVTPPAGVGDPTFNTGFGIGTTSAAGLDSADTARPDLNDGTTGASGSNAALVATLVAAGSTTDPNPPPEGGLVAGRQVAEGTTGRNNNQPPADSRRAGPTTNKVFGSSALTETLGGGLPDSIAAERGGLAYTSVREPAVGGDLADFGLEIPADAPSQGIFGAFLFETNPQQVAEGIPGLPGTSILRGDSLIEFQVGSNGGTVVSGGQTLDLFALR